MSEFFSNRQLVEVQSELIERFDEDIDVEITADRLIQVRSAKALGLDFLIMPVKVVLSSLKESAFIHGTSKAPPKVAAATIMNGEELLKHILQWRETLLIAESTKAKAKR